MPREPAIPCLGVYSEEQKTEMGRSGCHVPSNRVSDKQQLAIRTVNDCSVFSRRGALTRVVVGMDLEDIRLSEVGKPVTARQECAVPSM